MASEIGEMVRILEKKCENMFVGFVGKGGRCGVAVHRLLCKLSLYLREYSST